VARTIKQKVEKFRRELEALIAKNHGYSEVCKAYSAIMEIQKLCPHNLIHGDEDERWCAECNLRDP